MSGSVVSLQEGRWKYTRNGLVRRCEAPVTSRTQPDDGKEGWAMCWYFYVDSGLGSQTAPSSSARRNHNGIAEEEWTGQVQENSERLLNPLYAVFTVTKESMYLRHGSAQALLPGSSEVKPWKYIVANFQRRHEKASEAESMLSSSQINWPGSCAAEWVINSRPDGNASGDRPYINIHLMWLLYVYTFSF